MMGGTICPSCSSSAVEPINVDEDRVRVSCPGCRITFEVSTEEWEWGRRKPQVSGKA